MAWDWSELEERTFYKLTDDWDVEEIQCRKAGEYDGHDVWAYRSIDMKGGFQPRYNFFIFDEFPPDTIFQTRLKAFHRMKAQAKLQMFMAKFSIDRCDRAIQEEEKEG